MAKVWIALPDGGAPALATESQFKTVWKARGYELVKPDLGAAASAGYVAADEAGLPADYVRRLLAARTEADAAPAAKPKKTIAAPAASTPGEGGR